MRRVLPAALAVMAAAAVVTAAPAPAATTQISVSSVGSSVMSLHLDQALSLGEAGLPVSFGPVSTWGAVVIAKQDPGVSALSGTTWTGVGLLSDGGRSQAVPLGGVTRLPPGGYALYVLAPSGYRLTATLSLPGVSSTALSTWSRRMVPVTATHNSLVASVAALSDRVPATTKPGGAMVIMGATTGTPVAHDLAACLVEGAVPTGAEAECGTSQLATYSQDSRAGYGDATLAVAVPKLPAGHYTAVLRGEATGLGTGITFTTLQWSWTAPWRVAVR